ITLRHAGNETILLVEDEDGVRALIRHVLEKQGYNILEAKTGQEAVAFCHVNGNPIHLLLTDVVLSHMSGRDVAQKIVHSRPEVKVLFMSGYSEEAIVQHGVLDKGTFFIQKPFTNADLALKVR